MADELQSVLETVYERCRGVCDGEVATYIPELGRADPEDFGLALASVDEQLHTVGDWQKPFTIQSISKPFAFALALDLLGRDRVLGTVGVEPSGDAFNAIELEPARLRPFNPMVNAGAIAVASLLYRARGNEAFDFALDRFSAAAGRPLALDNAVYLSESATGHRNRAMAYLMLNYGIIEREVEAVVDLYFRCCAILVHAGDLAVMGATLANVGENPFTGQEVFNVVAVRDTLSVMFTCGMYDYAGNWAFRVGLPAKSGVAGGILGVVNRQMGIGSYSPRLDSRGNSVRGIAACEGLAEDLGLHVFESLNRGSSFLSTLLHPPAP